MTDDTQKQSAETENKNDVLPPDLQEEVKELQKKVDKVAGVVDSILKREK